jgi:hypothetical protein
MGFTGNRTKLKEKSRLKGLFPPFFFEKMSARENQQKNCPSLKYQVKNKEAVSIDF